MTLHLTPLLSMAPMALASSKRVKATKEATKEVVHVRHLLVLLVLHAPLLIKAFITKLVVRLALITTQDLIGVIQSLKGRLITPAVRVAGESLFPECLLYLVLGC